MVRLCCECAAYFPARCWVVCFPWPRCAPACLTPLVAALAGAGQNIRKLIKDGFVIRKPQKIHSRDRARRALEAKRKGRHTGYGEGLLTKLLFLHVCVTGLRFAEDLKATRTSSSLDQGTIASWLMCIPFCFLVLACVVLLVTVAAGIVVRKHAHLSVPAWPAGATEALSGQHGSAVQCKRQRGWHGLTRLK